LTSPTTRSFFTFGIRPTGESRPRGDVSVTMSPTPALSVAASALPRITGGGPSLVGRSNSSTLPSISFETTSVTVRSCSGTMPLRVAAAAPFGVVSNALP
jgi:hypothetical protein